MTLKPAHRWSLLGATAALALTGCVDMFTQAPADAERWRGTTTAGNPALPECGSFLFEVGEYHPRSFLWQTVSGRAWPLESPESLPARWSESATQWWLEGYVNEAQFVQLETKMQRPVYFRARPYSVWRGTIAGDRMALTESGSPCNRTVVLARG